MPRAAKLQHFVPVLALCCLLGRCLGQGTMTLTFERQPAGTIGTISDYSELGMTFWNPYGVENLARIGPGLSGYPDDGTAYLAVTLGAKLGFSFNTHPETYFNLLSFDAANYGGNLPRTLTVVGYKGAMGRVVTNYFTTAFNFQTFYLDSQFQRISRVDVLTDRWSLDNVVISGVPEPSAGALALLGTGCAFWFRRLWGRHDA